MDCKQRMLAGFVFAALVSPQWALGQAPQAIGQPPQAAQPPAAPQPTVVVTVNGDPISQQEVQANLQPRIQGQQVDPQSLQTMQNEVINGLIDGRLVEQYAIENGPPVEQQEVAEVLERLDEQLATQQVSMQEFLASRGDTEQSIRQRVKGSLAWRALQEKQLTEENLNRYFQQHQDRFNAESIDQVRDQVASAYMEQLWTSIVREMRSEAEIQAAVPAAR